MKRRLLAFITCMSLFLTTGCMAEKNTTTVSENSATAYSQSNTSEALNEKTENAKSEISSSTELTSSTAKTAEESSSSSTTKKTQVKTTTVKQKTTTVKPAADTVICTVEISCKTILGNMKNLKKEKTAFVPSDGIILKKTTVKLEKGSTVFDALKTACKENHCKSNCRYCKNGIQLEYEFTPGYNSYYIEGIHQLYEKDCGTESGWMYCVNGVFPNKGCDSYTVQNGDEIQWLYTCDLGSDVGNTY